MVSTGVVAGVATGEVITVGAGTDMAATADMVATAADFGKAGLVVASQSGRDRETGR